jgi:hypothetical protein
VPLPPEAEKACAVFTVAVAFGGETVTPGPTWTSAWAASPYPSTTRTTSVTLPVGPAR